MKKKVLSILLSAAMVASVLAGCGSSSGTSDTQTTETADSTESSESTDSADSSESTGEKTKLKALFIAHPLTADVETFQWLQEMEDAAGVEIEWEVIRADWDQVKATRFASGDIPDILFNATIDSDYTTYNGLFLNLNDYITEENTPNICAMFEEEPDTKVLAETMEGNIYGLPKFQGKWPGTNTVMFINQVWLDNLGLEAPTTF